MSDLYALVDKSTAQTLLLRGQRTAVLQEMERAVAQAHSFLGGEDRVKATCRAVGKGNEHLRQFIEGESDHATWGGFRLQAVSIQECK